MQKKTHMFCRIMSLWSYWKTRKASPFPPFLSLIHILPLCFDSAHVLYLSFILICNITIFVSNRTISCIPRFSNFISKSLTKNFYLWLGVSEVCLLTWQNFVLCHLQIFLLVNYFYWLTYSSLHPCFFCFFLFADHNRGF
jgi:hypothetical protein